jgi:glutamine synthetase
MLPLVLVMLVMAMMTRYAAGLDGIKKKTDPGSPVNENIYKMSNTTCIE